ncbi:MAG: tetratricopeptide repeat protein [Candidatus Omnitrophota bacterium]
MQIFLDFFGCRGLKNTERSCLAGADESLFETPYSQKRISILKFLVLASLSFSTIGWAWWNPIARKDKEARELYKEDKVDKALKKWKDAQIDNPHNNELQYNIGNALHKLDKYEDAYKEYGKSVSSKDDELKAKAYYNMGNTNYRLGKLNEAIDSYKNTLAIEPDDEDAKYNIEFIQKLLDKKKEESSKKKDPEKNEENKDQQEKSQGSRGESQDQKEASSRRELEGQEDKKEENNGSGEKGSGEKKEEPKEDRSSEGSQEKEAKSQKPEMSKEDAMRLLDALKDDERDIQKSLIKQYKEGSYNVEKDW